MRHGGVHGGQVNRADLDQVLRHVALAEVEVVGAAAIVGGRVAAGDLNVGADDRRLHAECTALKGNCRRLWTPEHQPVLVVECLCCNEVEFVYP